MPDRQPLGIAIPPQLLDALAKRIAALLPPKQPEPPEPSPWLNFQAACTYLGFSRDTLYKLTAARAIPCRKKAGGQGLRFHRGELDAWMESQYPRLDRLG
ncbi:MAG: helix-turn-helix transcriptional regulator [Solirubrobacteraceae bacterium]